MSWNTDPEYGKALEHRAERHGARFDAEVDELFAEMLEGIRKRLRIEAEHGPFVVTMRRQAREVGTA